MRARAGVARGAQTETRRPAPRSANGLVRVAAVSGSASTSASTGPGPGAGVARADLDEEVSILVLVAVGLGLGLRGPRATRAAARSGDASARALQP